MPKGMTESEYRDAKRLVNTLAMNRDTMSDLIENYERRIEGLSASIGRTQTELTFWRGKIKEYENGPAN